MKRIIVVLFMLLSAGAFSKDIAANEVTAFRIDADHVYISSDIPVDKKNVIDMAAKELKNNFAQYKVIAAGGEDQQADTGSGTITAVKETALTDRDKIWYINVEITSIGAVYPIAYNVRMSFQEFEKINSSIIGVCMQNDFNADINQAVSSVIMELGIKFLKLRAQYK